MITSCFAKKNTKCETMSQMMIRMEDNMEDRRVYCNSCPCLFKDYQIDETTGETTGIWWTCGVDRYEIEFGNIPQNRVFRKSGCPLKRIELINGLIIRPDEREIW